MIPFFVHVPKTAGSSIRTLLTLNYSPSEVASLYVDTGNIFSQCSGLIGKTTGLKLVQGHMPYGTHLNLGLRNARYFSFLRHPVDRHFSDVAHGLRDETHGFHALLTIMDDPMGWATVSDTAIYYKNTATHYLSGTFFSRDVYLADFHRAAQVVLESEFIGIAERFNESILIMARKLGWSKVVYEKRNVASNPLNKAITTEIRAACEARLHFDMALYQIACERFEQEVRAYGSHLQEAAHQLEELVSVQSKTNPELEKREYLVGQPVTANEAMNPKFSTNSPLGLWLGGQEQEVVPAFCDSEVNDSRFATA